MRPKPLGLVLLGMLAGLLGAVLLVFFLVLSVGGPLGLAARAGLAGLAAMSLVAAEALVRMRPWFYRASFWLVVAMCVLIITFCVAYEGVNGVLVAFMILFLLMSFLVPILFYVRDEARLMAPRPARRPPPVPRRVP